MYKSILCAGLPDCMALCVGNGCALHFLVGQREPGVGEEWGGEKRDAHPRRRDVEHAQVHVRDVQVCGVMMVSGAARTVIDEGGRSSVRGGPALVVAVIRP